MPVCPTNCQRATNQPRTAQPPVNRQVHLKEAVQEMAGKLDAEVAEGGSNFSLGQKQARRRLCA